jgi:hypothetical protein
LSARGTASPRRAIPAASRAVGGAEPPLLIGVAAIMRLHEEAGQ